MALGQRDSFEIMCFHCIKKNEEYNIWYFVFVVGPVQLEYININKVG